MLIMKKFLFILALIPLSCSVIDDLPASRHHSDKISMEEALVNLNTFMSRLSVIDTKASFFNKTISFNDIYVVESIITY